MFPSYDESFKQFAAVPNDMMDADLEDNHIEPEDVNPNSREAQSLLHGLLLAEIVSLHTRYGKHSSY